MRLQKGFYFWTTVIHLYEEVDRVGFPFGGLDRRSAVRQLGTFRKDYIAQAIVETRQGDCHRCGQCCALIYKCPFLGKDSQNLPYCRIYGDLRPYNCRNYPFDAADAEIDACGFKFKEPTQVK